MVFDDGRDGGITQRNKIAYGKQKHLRKGTVLQ